MMKKVLLLVLIILFGIVNSGCETSNYPRRGDKSNTLYVGSVASSFPVSFMPWLSRDGIAPTISSLVYDTLFNFDEDTGIFTPRLAKEWYYVDQNGQPILTDDGRIDYDRLEAVYGDSKKKYLPVKIILNEGITWSDGKPFTAEDVFYSFDIGTNTVLSNHAGSLAWTNDLQHSYKNGELTKQGIFTYSNGALEQGYPISEAEKDKVLYIHVNKVLGAVTTLFTTILILPEHIWRPIVTVDNQLNSREPLPATLYQYQHPVGTGPYLLDFEQSNAQIITLKRRNDYHRLDDEGKMLYKIEKIRFLLYQEVNVAIYALLKGHIDVLDSTVSSNYLSLFENDKNLFISKAEGLFTQSLVINLNPITTECNPMRNLLKDVEFRKAIALAINQDELIYRVLNGAGIKMSSGLMRETLVDFYNPSTDNLPQDYQERINEANSILDKSFPTKDSQGYRLLDSQRITYNILGSPGEKEVISYLQIQLQKIGIEVKFVIKGSSPEKTYLYPSKFDMTIQGVTFSLSNLDIMYMAHFVNLGTSSNYGRISDQNLKNKINEMRTTLNLNRKYDLIKEIQPLIADTYYKLPLYSATVISVARTDRFTGYKTVTGDSVFNSESLQSLVQVD